MLCHSCLPLPRVYVIECPPLNLLYYPPIVLVLCIYTVCIVHFNVSYCGDDKDKINNEQVHAML